MATQSFVTLLVCRQTVGGKTLLELYSTQCSPVGRPVARAEVFRFAVSVGQVWERNGSSCSPLQWKLLISSDTSNPFHTPTRHPFIIGIILKDPERFNLENLEWMNSLPKNLHIQTQSHQISHQVCPKWKLTYSKHLLDPNFIINNIYASLAQLSTSMKPDVSWRQDTSQRGRRVQTFGLVLLDGLEKVWVWVKALPLVLPVVGGRNEEAAMLRQHRLHPP